MLVLASAPLVLLGRLAWIPAGLIALLAAAQVPMTIRLLRRLRRARYVFYAAMSFGRAFWRGVGMAHGVFGYLLAKIPPLTQSKPRQ